MAASPSLEARIAKLWYLGNLRFILSGDQHQLDAYDRYRQWAEAPPEVEGAFYDDVYVVDWGRRTGKTTWRLVVRLEDCIRLSRKLNRPARLRIASAYEKNVQEVVDDVAGFVLDTCPKALRPEYKNNRGPAGAGFYFPESMGGGFIRLVGLDKDPHGLRGRASDGDDLSEAAFIRHLTHAVKSVLLPQYQGRPWARLCLESTAPEEVDTEYDRVFVEDAKLRGAYTFATLEDNPRLTRQEKDKFIREAGGMDDPVCQREYFGVRGRPAETVVLPAFSPDRHVVEFDRPEYALAYTFADAGFWPDYFAILWLWVEPSAAKIRVWSDWLQHNAGTHEVARAVQAGERDAFLGVKRWSSSAGVIVEQGEPPERPEDGLEGFFDAAEPLKEDREREDLLHRPYARVMDGEPRLRSDLSRNDGLHFGPADNRDPDAQMHVLNRLFADDKVEIHPRAKATIAHCQSAHRDKNGRLARSDVHGHFDAMRCLAYAAVMVDWHTDPVPPRRVLDSRSGTAIVYSAPTAQNPNTRALDKMMKPTRWKPRRG
ncbi:MAG: hypothetical protein VW405_02820 [Rhodospirillaceae bacterium]